MNRAPCNSKSYCRKTTIRKFACTKCTGTPRIRGASERAVPRAMERRDCRNGGEASWGAVRGRGLVRPLTPWQHKSFEYGTWGGEFRAEFVPAPGEIVAQEHWCSSGFANTDLDLQLKKHGIHKLIVIGLIAHTCIEATVRYAAELGYEVTVVNDAMADYSDEMMHAALDINMPNYANAIVSADEIVAAIATL